MSRIVEGHTVHAYDGELSVMHLLLVEMGGLVSDQVHQALGFFACDRAINQIQTVIERDNKVDDFELKIDAEIQSLLARRTPVARDLRIVIACSKVVSDLERVGDEAIKVVQVAAEIESADGISAINQSMLATIKKTGDMAYASLRGAIEVLDTFDPQLARSVINAERQLDVEFRDIIRQIIMDDTSQVGGAIHTVQVIKALERIGDHAKNIAEHVIFLISGEDVRHVHN